MRTALFFLYLATIISPLHAQDNGKFYDELERIYTAALADAVLQLKTPGAFVTLALGADSNDKLIAPPISVWNNVTKAVQSRPGQHAKVVKLEDTARARDSQRTLLRTSSEAVHTVVAQGIWWAGDMSVCFAVTQDLDGSSGRGWTSVLTRTKAGWRVSERIDQWEFTTDPEVGAISANHPHGPKKQKKQTSPCRKSIAANSLPRSTPHAFYGELTELYTAALVHAVLQVKGSDALVAISLGSETNGRWISPPEPVWTGVRRALRSHQMETPHLVAVNDVSAQSNTARTVLKVSGEEVHMIVAGGFEWFGKNRVRFLITQNPGVLSGGGWISILKKNQQGWQVVLKTDEWISSLRPSDKRAAQRHRLSAPQSALVQRALDEPVLRRR